MMEDNPYVHCWRKLLEEALQEEGETFDDIIASTFEGDELDRRFHESDWGPEFTAWSCNRVYFPAISDARQWVHSVPRHPCEEKTYPVGDGGWPTTPRTQKY